MVKSIITVALAVMLVWFASVWEYKNLNGNFNEVIEYIDKINIKLDDGSATVDDIKGLQSLWIDKKQKLHVYIPHTEIKEIDLWIAESMTYVKYNKFDEAMAKLVVVKLLCQQIPKTFSIKFENLF